MDSQEQARDRLESGGAALGSAQKDISIENFIPAIQMAQVAIEQAIKAVVACFATPEWEHNVSAQLTRILSIHGDQMIQRCGEGIIKDLQQLANDNRDTHEWHGWSIYGRRDNLTGRWLIPKLVCTREVALWILPLAERSCQSAKDFIQRWYGR